MGQETGCCAGKTGKATCSLLQAGRGWILGKKTWGGEHCCTGIIPKDPASLTCILIHETCLASIASLQMPVTGTSQFWRCRRMRIPAEQSEQLTRQQHHKQWLEQHKQQTTIATCTVYCKKGTATCKAGVGKVWQQYKTWMTSSEWERFLPYNSILTKSWRVTIATRLSSRRRLFWRTAALMDVDDTTQYRVTLQHGLRTPTGVQEYGTPAYTHRTPHTGILTPHTPHRHSHTAPL